MPLSPEEQRQLDRIELHLHDDDPTLVSGVNHAPARRHGIVGGLAVLFGSVVLLTGVVAAQAWLGARIGIAFSPIGLLIGTVGMLTVAGWLFGLRRSSEPPPPDRKSARPGH